jgi:hypothetical protein
MATLTRKNAVTANSPEAREAIAAAAQVLPLQSLLGEQESAQHQIHRTRSSSAYWHSAEDILNQAQAQDSEPQTP